MAVQAPLQGSLQFVVHAGRTSFTIHIPMMPTPILRSAMYTNSDDEREVYRSIVGIARAMDERNWVLIED